MARSRYTSSTTAESAVRLLAVDLYEDTPIPERLEREMSGIPFIVYGDRNAYPIFLYDTVQQCATLKTIISGTTDYVVGNSVECNVARFAAGPSRRETWPDIVAHIAADYLTFGVSYVQCIRNAFGEPVEYAWIDSRFIRRNKRGDVYYYSEEFGKPNAKRRQMLVYKKFATGDQETGSSVLEIRTPLSRGVYGSPIWDAAIKDAVIEGRVEQFHLNEITNNFTSSAIVNFNNGKPTDEQAAEIERLMTEKFSGSANAGRFYLSFNDDKDQSTTVERLQADDFDKRYIELAKRTREQIFISFRAVPALFGLMTESKGFSTEEFDQAFRLYNRTMVRPIQMRIVDAFDKLMGATGSLTIDPFSMDDNTDNKEVQ